MSRTIVKSNRQSWNDAESENSKEGGATRNWTERKQKEGDGWRGNQCKEQRFDRFFLKKKKKKVNLIIILIGNCQVID